MDVDPIWHPGSIWPGLPDDDMTEEAVVQIYSPDMGRGYITTVSTQGLANPFFEHAGEDISWAYMRDIEERLVDELTATNERWKEINRRKKEQKQSEVLIEREAVAEPKREAKQLSFDFGF